MHRLALVGYLAFALLAVSLVNRIGAQTQPIAGLTAVAISGGVTGPPSLFPDGSGAAPSIAFQSQQTLGCWRQGSNDMRCGGSGVAAGFTVQNSSGIIFAAGVGSVSGIWNVTSGGALQNVSSTSGTIVMATTTIFNASGTLRNAPMNFNELNLYLTAAGMQGWCGNCTPAGAFDQTCAAGAGNGSLAVRDGAGVFKCYS